MSIVFGEIFHRLPITGASSNNGEHSFIKHYRRDQTIKNFILVPYKFNDVLHLLSLKGVCEIDLYNAKATDEEIKHLVRVHTIKVMSIHVDCIRRNLPSFTYYRCK